MRPLFSSSPLRYASLVDVAEILCEATVAPYEVAGLHLIKVIAKDDETPVGRLEAVRWSETAFTLGADIHSLTRAFDYYTQASYDLAEDIVRRKDAIRRVFNGDDLYAGAIAILSIRTEPVVAGHRLGLDMLAYLRDAHSGLPWLAFMLAVPIDLEHDDPAFLPLQTRLIRYYTSEPKLGFREFGDIQSPGLLLASWDVESGSIL